MKEICNVKEFSGDDSFLSAIELVSSDAIPEKEQVLKYLKSFDIDCTAGMSLLDEITGEDVGVGVNGYEDGDYYWDTRHIYHFEKYNLKLDERFVHHVLKANIR